MMTDIWKVIIRTPVQHVTATDVQHSEVQQLIRDYHASMNAEIGATVVIDSDDDNVFFYDNGMSYQLKADDGAYYSFEKDVDVDEAVDCTRS